MQHYVLRHPHGEVCIDDPQDWHIRQVRIIDDMISPGSPTRSGHTLMSRRGASVRKRSSQGFGSSPVTARRIAPISV
jgi:hypothetical protein